MNQRYYQLPHNTKHIYLSPYAVLVIGVSCQTSGNIPNSVLPQPNGLEKSCTASAVSPHCQALASFFCLERCQVHHIATKSLRVSAASR